MRIGNGRIECISHNGDSKLSALAKDVQAKNVQRGLSLEIKLKDGSKFLFLPRDEGVSRTDLRDLIFEEAGRPLKK